MSKLLRVWMYIKTRKLRSVVILFFLCILFGSTYFSFEYGYMFHPPTARIPLGSHFPDLPPDERHHYLEFFVDHDEPSRGTFMGFFRLSPNFQKGSEVIFYLTDGQQEKVGLSPWDEYFEGKLEGLSYVTICRRGHYPILFPEVFDAEGKPDLKEALQLYGTSQQIEDIETVRLAMLAKGLIPPHGKIMLYGTSGGGILIEQYLAKYGRNVSRALIEASYGGDVFRKRKGSYDDWLLDRMATHSPETLAKLTEIVESGDVDRTQFSFLLQRPCYFSFQGEQFVLDLIDDVHSGGKWAYWKALCHPGYNFTVVDFMMQLPIELAVKVRCYEILGERIVEYRKRTSKRINLMYEWAQHTISDFITAREMGAISAVNLGIEGQRQAFTGEIVFMAADGDHVFPSEAVQLSAMEYPTSRFALFHDTHIFGVEDNQQYYRDVRRTFFEHGLHSPEFDTVMSDGRQLNREESRTHDGSS